MSKNGKKKIFLIFMIAGLSYSALFGFNFNTTIENNKNNDILTDIDEIDDDINSYLEISGVSTVSESLSRIFKISNHTKESQAPSIAVDSNKNVHFVWSDSTNTTYSDIFYRNFTYSTQLWSEVVNISRSSGDPCTNPDIEIDSNDKIHITWTENEAGNRNIKYKKISITPYQESVVANIATSANQEDNSAIATNGTNTVTISWTDLNVNRIYVALYDTVGQSILDSAQVVPSALDFSDLVYSSNGELHLVVQYDGTTIGYYKRTNTAWDAIVNLTTGLAPTNNVANPSIAYDPMTDVIYVTWSNSFVTDSGNNDIVIKNKTIGGSFTDHSIVISNIPGDDDDFPEVEIDRNGNIYTIYKKDTNEIHFNRLNDTTTTKLSENTGHSRYRPNLIIDADNSVHLVWEDWIAGAPNYEIYYRLFDTYLPQLVVTTLNNDTMFSGVQWINSTVDYDNYEINYLYWNDIDGDGLVEDGDGGSWHAIGTTNSSTGWDFEWDTNKTGSEVNERYLVLKVNATDITGNDESVLIGNLTIDNTIPARSEIVKISDDAGRDSSLGARHFNGTITIEFFSYDAISGVKNATLFNGTINLGGNTTDNTFVFDTTSGAMDGNYSNLFIVIYDNSGTSNTSAEYPLGEYIEIDNVRPTITFELANDTEQTGVIGINIQTHLDVWNVSLYNSTSPLFTSASQVLPVNNNTATWWNFTYDSNGFNGTMYFLAHAIDEMGYNETLMLKIYVDNKDPGVNITNYHNNDPIGITHMWVIVDVDIDTVNVTLYWKDFSGSPFELAVFNTSFDIIDSLRKRTYLNFTKAIEATGSSLFLKVNATDDIGLVSDPNPTGIELNLVTELADPLNQILYTISGFNITLFWTQPYKASYFLIYRDLRPFNSKALDTLVLTNPNGFLALMGNDAGVKYCIAKVLNNTGTDQNNYTDVTFGPRTYYYLIVSMNVYIEPSKVATVDITIEAQTVGRTTQDNQTQNWPIFFLVFLIIVSVISELQVKRIKRVHYKGRVKTQFGEISRKELASFEEKGLDLDARAPGEISIGVSRPQMKGRYEDLLEKDDDDMATFDKEPSGAINNCPTCGWILSSTAIKCPRCGWRKIV